MKSMKWKAVFLAACLVFSAAGKGAARADQRAGDKARMDAAVQFAETVLKYGRDTYGAKHTPLFVDGLNVDTMKPPEKIYIFKLRGKPTPRGGPWLPLISSNLVEQGNLVRLLVGLSGLTGDPKYKNAYKDSIRYHFKHYQWDSGLLNMGYHRFVDLRHDRGDGDRADGLEGHELKSAFPYYDLFWETDADCSAGVLEWRVDP